MKMIAVLLLVLFLGGCSGYQFTGGRKNLVVENIAPRTFTVNFCGSEYMSRKKVEDYTMQRAAEITLDKGYTHFVVLKKDDKSRGCTLNQRGRYDAKRSTNDSYDFQPFMKPNLTLTVQCFSKGENLPKEAIDAQEMTGSGRT